MENNITKGTTDTTFDPEDTLTTAHIVTFLYRTKNPGMDGWNGEAAAWAADENGKPFSSPEEIDILACDEKEKNFIIGECKFRNEAFDLHEFDKLKAKHERKGSIYYYLFSLGGFTDTVKNLAEKEENIYLIEPSEMVNR